MNNRGHVTIGRDQIHADGVTTASRESTAKDECRTAAGSLDAEVGVPPQNQTFHADPPLRRQALTNAIAQTTMA
jgi:hypothetical protein